MSDLTDPGTLEEARKIREIIETRPLPDSVNAFHLEFGTDSTGDPSVNIWLVVDDDPNPPKHVLEKTTKFVRQIESELHDLRLRHWPYVRFIRAHEAREYFS